MTSADLAAIAQAIVADAVTLKNRHAIEPDAPISYCCVFPASVIEADTMRATLATMGTVVYHIDDIPVYQLHQPVPTNAGSLHLLKINDHDPAQTERGYADFSLADYTALRSRTATDNQLKITPYPAFEIIELLDVYAGVRVYFPDIPLDKELGINN